MKTKAEETMDKFHAHLDVCQQCREHPFDLCSTGALLLMLAGSAAVEPLGGGGPSNPYSMSAEVEEACDCDHEPDEEHKANCKFWSVPVTGRLVTGRSEAPRMQNIPTRTETGKQLRAAFAEPLITGKIHFLEDTSVWEHRVHRAFHRSQQKPSCPFCAAGIPFEEE